MNVKPCASSNRPTCWKEINFNIAKGSVKKLQKRIYAACSQGNAGKVETLTNLMMHSFYAKVCAIQHVCSARGKKTAGVDGIRWLNDEDKFNAIDTLRQRGYKPSPLKRVCVKKPDGGYRVLGIPTMKDRAIQTLYKFALEPVAEFFSDEHSYGFRHEHSVKKAILHLENELSKHPEWELMLKTDVESCFDNISHEWLMEHIPVNVKLLHKIIKSGFVEKGNWYPTNKGVPQGGSVSSVICNLTLDGLEDVCTDIRDDRCSPVRGTDNRCSLVRGTDIRCSPIHMIRYADDILMYPIGDMEFMKAVIPVIDNFLSERGLCLSAKKTSLSDIKNGIVFLGWEISKQNGMIQCVPSQKAIKSLFGKVHKIVLNEGCFSEKLVKQKLKCLIRGWLSFYSIATYPSLRDVEFDLVKFMSQVTGNRELLKYIQNLFVTIQDPVIQR